MGKEIERKYLVTGEYKSLAYASISIKQGYILSNQDKTVRIRIAGKNAYITIKGIRIGITRFEWEKEIEVSEAEELMKLCSDDIIIKKRHLIKHGKYTVEVDEFSGKNTGLILAEIEFESEDENPELPDWIGKEVSNYTRYYNSNLSQNPYSSWDTA